MISLLVLLAPLIGAISLFRMKPEEKDRIRRVATFWTSIPLFLSLWMWMGYDTAGERWQYLFDIDWVPSLGLGLRLGVDGISVAMVVLTSVVIWTGCYVSRSIQDRVKEHYILLLVLVVGVFGVFLSLDLFFFYFFYEMAVIPMFLLIGIWGSRAAQYSKEYATMKLTLYLTLGAVVALVGILAVYFAGGGTFDLRELSAVGFSDSFQITWFPVIFLGFACIVPMWPLHSWSPIGHAAAPSSVSMLHAGVLMKLGAFGMLRLGLDVLPVGAQYWMGWVAALCCMNILYGGLVAMAQRDMKFIIGFSSSSHMGYVLLGLATLGVTGVSGAVFLMFAHGIMTALAFGLIGFFYEQTHTRVVGRARRHAQEAALRSGPASSSLAMASAGLPGFANFASELLVLLGAWKSEFPLAGTNVVIPGWIPTSAAIWGIVVSATYLLRAVRDAFYGPLNPRWDGLEDARTRTQRTPFIVLVLILAFTGCFPSTIVSRIESGVKQIRAVRSAPAETAKEEQR
ncbi:MAG: NADH-quinone oxidoreductase subunit M [Planctomycetes bacterium]|nr:NADH-quinone oxidoreductase subunit M [Planctomycetota bacterium]